MVSDEVGVVGRSLDRVSFVINNILILLFSKYYGDVIVLRSTDVQGDVKEQYGKHPFSFL